MQKSKAVFVQIFMSAFTISFAVSLNDGIAAKISSVFLQNARMDFSSIYIFAVINCCVLAILFTCGVGILGALLSQIAKNQKSLALHIASGAGGLDIFKLVVIEWTLRAAALPAVLGLLTSTAVVVLFGGKTGEILFAQLSFRPALFATTLFGVLLFCVAVSVYPALKAMRTNVIAALAA
ncbi:MAG: FtsX-like permease family protein [Clostridia bacterium]|jgi:ABC-type antimicrobial peptide transport system permease subunit|nr:FtsX-like permease family protein [Clostridia bacterium]NLS85947.1 hypothetical protein [Oscillospiraceae bacterium]